MRLEVVARGAVTRGYPWSNRSSLPVLPSDLPQEGLVHNGTQYSSELPDKETHVLLSVVEVSCFA